MSTFTPLRLHSPTLLTLPLELLLIITTHLPLSSRMLLRSVSQLFASFIPPPTHQQLLQAEIEVWYNPKFFTCGGCVGLRHKRWFSFSKRNYLFDMEAGGGKAGERFCNECGGKDLGDNGQWRYEIGEVWDRGEHGEYWTRCERCSQVGIIARVRGSGLCQVCFEKEAPRKRVVESKEDTSRTAFLINLPSEVLRNVVAMLEIEDRMLLRSVSRIFYKMIQRPTHSELLAIESKPWARHNLFACGGCIRLRHYYDFDTNNTCEYLNREQGGQNAHERFCRDCGVRDLPGPFRYGLGDTWNDSYFDGKWWVRCYDCGRTEEIWYDAIHGDEDVCEACDEVGRGRYMGSVGVEDSCSRSVWTRIPTLTYGTDLVLRPQH